ncbi:MAG: patatin-like phospholipase family protein [Pseudomonadota bacterium]
MRALIVLLAIGLAGCTTPTRNPSAAADIEFASPYGIPGIVRVWGDNIDNEQVENVTAGMIDRAEMKHAADIAAGRQPRDIALALSGGGADGAFGAGVLAGWTKRGDRPTFDVVSGVSTGAIIGLFAFLGPDYDDDLRSFYTEYSTEQLFEPSPFAALTGGTSLSDTEGYNALINETIDGEIVEAIAKEAEKGRILLIGTTNLDYARPVIWNVTQIARSGHPQATALIRDLVRASSAIPALFPPVLIPTVTASGEVRDELHVDGGATQQVMLFSPELPLSVIDDALGVKVDRTLYVIVNNTLDKAYDPVDLGVLSIAGKAVSSLIGGSGTGDLYKMYAVTARDGIDFNVLSIPQSFDLEPTEPFDTAYMTELYLLGEEIGANGIPWRDRPPNFALRSAN